jgi:hypothetical protein
MNRTARFAAVLLPVFLLLACGNTGEEATNRTEPGNVLITEQPVVRGWMELVLPDGAPSLLCTDEDCAWLLLEGGILMQFSGEEGIWRCYDIDETVAASDMAASGGKVFLLAGHALLVFDGDELASVAVPEDLVPVAVEADGQVALLCDDGTVAVLTDDYGFETVAPAEPLEVGSTFLRAGEDWVFVSSDGVLQLVDTGMGLRRFEDIPFETDCVLASDGSCIFLGTEGSVYRRSGPGQWDEICSGKLFETGLVLRDEGVAFAGDLDRMIATRPAIDPLGLFAEKSGEPVWVLDTSGVLAWSELGSIETRLPLYDMERIECNLAGQTGSSGTGLDEEVEPMDIAVSGVFRIYESVSSRPDPFTEFPPTRRDLRRSLDEIAVEELHLVGITLDPTGGDQAMVEDVNGVPYILYEGTELANNTHIAEITSNEVIVVQEVAVGTGGNGSETTSIPTIYSMRLHEEGGL